LAIGHWLLAILRRGLNCSNSPTYTIALKTLGFISFFFIMNGSPLSAGPVQFSGGDGSSIGSAVVITGAKHESDGITAEHRYLSEHFASWFLKRQVLVNQKGRVYDRMEITDQNGKERAVFFDITDFFGK
jgi:hypothetical protein